MQHASFIKCQPAQLRRGWAASLTRRRCSAHAWCRTTTPTALQGAVRRSMPPFLAACFVPARFSYSDSDSEAPPATVTQAVTVRTVRLRPAQLRSSWLFQPSNSSSYYYWSLIVCWKLNFKLQILRWLWRGWRRRSGWRVAPTTRSILQCRCHDVG